MRNTTLALLFSFIAFMGHCQKMNDLKRLGLKDAVASIEILTYTIPNDSFPSNIEFTSLKRIYFNDQGNISKVDKFKGDQQVGYEIYTYDKAGILLESTGFNMDSSFFNKVTYEADKYGYKSKAWYKRSVQKHYSSNRYLIDVEYELYYKQLFVEVDYVNDHLGNLEAETFYAEDKSFVQKLTYRYDYLGRKIETNYFNERILVWKRSFRYGRTNNFTQSKLFMSNRLAMISKYTYEFDEKGNWLERLEARDKRDNILTQDLSENSILIKRKITYRE